MSSVLPASLPAEVRPAPRRFAIDYRWFAVAFVVLSGIYVGYRMYQQAYGMTVGLASTEPEFQTYWMTLFWTQLPILFGIAIAVQLYLIATRDRDIENVAPDVELKRYFSFTMWLVVYTFTFYWTGSFFAEGDGNWHQTVLRDTPITPSHIVLFYACIPIYLLFGVGSFVYAMTRIPAFCRGISLMHVFAVVGPFLILPNLGYNEWGHAYWLTEEIFSHPLHWGFVVLGWNALALAGVLMQIISRMRELLPIVFKAETTA
ncbi:MAG: methane monooxygenase/ammonia monooxygenase subunit C [Burkholderiales bacterium]|jgi:methane/ammonia monooxygenase subunit C|nr:methane monooxygenase/ammonia monooxygenase subunit C [Burkholderiales bacterium]